MVKFVETLQSLDKIERLCRNQNCIFLEGLRKTTRHTGRDHCDRLVMCSLTLTDCLIQTESGFKKSLKGSLQLTFARDNRKS